MKRLLLIAFIIMIEFSYAQNTGKLRGKITDASTGEPLIGANVILEGTTYGSATDIEGDYTILKVPSGYYTVVVHHLGYAKVLTKSVKILTDLTTTLNVQLTQSAIALKEEVVVVAEAPMIKKDMTSTESRITSEEIKNLPLQNINQLIVQQAGVNKDQNGNIHIRGGRSTEISYLLNGISITDDYTRSQALTVETESIQELQVISGTFNAEYGNAMSGVINMVTKTGGSKFESSLELWAGDYVSDHKNIFWGIEKFNPFSIYNIQASVGGPIVKDQLSYFGTVRRSYNEGYLYGINTYNPKGRSYPGDGSYVSMNSSERWSGQGTLEWQMAGNMKLKADGFGSREWNHYYTHTYRLNPNGEKGGTSTGLSFFTKLTHQVFSTTFHEVTLAYKYNEYISKLYDHADDPRYVHPDSLNAPGYHYYTAGTDLNIFQRSTESIIAKWDITSQINKYNLIKVGTEIQSDKVFYRYITLVPSKNANGQDLEPFVASIPSVESPNHDEFNRTPFKYAVYLQDKIELENMIINFGLRFESFDPRGRIPSDKTDPNIYNPFKLEHIYKDINKDGEIGLDEQFDANKYTFKEREAFWYKSASVKTLLSPRFGVAYPITDKGIIRFSYGIFQQIPEYSQLYLGDEFKLTSAQGIQGTTNDRNEQVPFGNNDLKPQRTTIYEIGLQQQFFENYSMDVTTFYRDIRDWISSSPPIPTYLAGISYSQRINRDFANVRGVTLAINKRFSDNFSFGIDYTYQVAEGTNSSSDEEFFSQLNGSEPKKILSPLSWSQTHTLNANLFVGIMDWGGSILANLSSGQPYTPSQIQGTITGKDVVSGLADNSMLKPMIFNVDLELFRNFKISDVDLQIYIRIFNVLDAKNPINVYTDTGKPDFTLAQKVVSYDKGWFDNPTYYSEPRSINIGTKISL